MPSLAAWQQARSSSKLHGIEPVQGIQKKSILRLFWLRALVMALLSWAVGARAQSAGFEGAEWIWSAPPAGRAALDQPAGVAWFRASLAVSEKAQIRSAELIITADNLYTVYLNGQFVGESEADPNAWNRAKRFDVARLVSAGHNVIAIEAVNTAPGPAGLLARLVVELADGQKAELATSPSWKCATQEQPNWQQPGLNDQAWAAAISLGAFGVAPWGKFAVARGSGTGRQPRPGERTRAARRLCLARGGDLCGRRLQSLSPGRRGPATVTTASRSRSSTRAIPGPFPSTTCPRR